MSQLEQRIDLLQYLSISKWQPMIGDFVIWHGLFTHWYGVINSVNTKNYTVEIIRAGLPFLLFTMTPSQMNKKSRLGSAGYSTVDVGDITSSKGGKYAVKQQHGAQVVWFV